MCEELAVTLKSGVLHFRHAYLRVQSSQVTLGKVIKLVILKPYRCNGNLIAVTFWNMLRNTELY